MTEYIEVMVIVEGKTEQIFVQQVLAPYLAQKNIYMRATQVSKPGGKGGDVRFQRVKNDIGNHLKQRADTYVTTLVDYYGIKEWPGIGDAVSRRRPEDIATRINQATKAEINALFGEQQSERRFIPYVAIHEFEALLFSDSAAIAAELGVSEGAVSAILDECGEPESINNSPTTAPSKRLDSLNRLNSYRKVAQGVKIAKEIGISKMREECPVFNGWISHFEGLVE